MPQFSIRFSDAEHERLKADAQAAGVKVSEWIRFKTVGPRGVPVAHTDEPRAAPADGEPAYGSQGMPTVPELAERAGVSKAKAQLWLAEAGGDRVKLDELSGVAEPEPCRHPTEAYDSQTGQCRACGEDVSYE
ncbi:MAG: hypothetical protein C4558_07495 [Dehalococcoidia bacterium]|nr:MAG: hypothetical protein C4558_07495 [Dehalococcoidia bacterium]